MDDEKVPERSLREELMAAKEEVESRGYRSATGEDRARAKDCPGAR